MAGTKIGGQRAATTNKAKYGATFYADIGAKGGKNGNTGGFAKKAICGCSDLQYDHIKAECAGRKGGVISRRGKAAR